jgi:hypothetical protein
MILIGDVFIASPVGNSLAERVEPWRYMLNQGQRRSSTNLLRLALAEAQKTFGLDSRKAAFVRAALKDICACLNSWMIAAS